MKLLHYKDLFYVIDNFLNASCDYTVSNLRAIRQIHMEILITGGIQNVICQDIAVEMFYTFREPSFYTFRVIFLHVEAFTFSVPHAAVVMLKHDTIVSLSTSLSDTLNIQYLMFVDS